MLLGQALREFLEEYSNLESRQRYALVLGRMADSVGRDKNLKDITPSDLRQFMAQWRPSLKSEATVVNYIKYMRTFFNSCVKDHYILHSPAANLKLPSLKNHAVNNAEKAMTDGELRSILNHYQHELIYEAIVRFAADTACRRKEVAELTVSRIDLKERWADVVSKGGEVRRVFFSKKTAQVLREWKLQRGNPDHDFFFCHDKGGYRPASISKIVRRASKKATKRNLGAHTLRHRRGHMMGKAKISPKTTQLTLGHASVQTTLDSYYLYDYDEVQRVAEEFYFEDDTIEPTDDKISPMKRIL